MRSHFTPFPQLLHAADAEAWGQLRPKNDGCESNEHMTSPQHSPVANPQKRYLRSQNHIIAITVLIIILITDTIAVVTISFGPSPQKERMVMIRVTLKDIVTQFHAYRCVPPCPTSTYLLMFMYRCVCVHIYDHVHNGDDTDYLWSFECVLLPFTCNFTVFDR